MFDEQPYPFTFSAKTAALHMNSAVVNHTYELPSTHALGSARATDAEAGFPPSDADAFQTVTGRGPQSGGLDNAVDKTSFAPLVTDQSTAMGLTTIPSSAHQTNQEHTLHRSECQDELVLERSVSTAGANAAKNVTPHGSSTCSTGQDATPRLQSPLNLERVAIASQHAVRRPRENSTAESPRPSKRNKRDVNSTIPIDFVPTRLNAAMNAHIASIPDETAGGANNANSGEARKAPFAQPNDNDQHVPQTTLSILSQLQSVPTFDSTAPQSSTTSSSESAIGIGSPATPSDGDVAPAITSLTDHAPSYVEQKNYPVPAQPQSAFQSTSAVMMPHPVYASTPMSTSTSGPMQIPMQMPMQMQMQTTMQMPMTAQMSNPYSNMGITGLFPFTMMNYLVQPGAQSSFMPAGILSAAYEPYGDYYGPQVNVAGIWDGPLYHNQKPQCPLTPLDTQPSAPAQPFGGRLAGFSTEFLSSQKKRRNAAPSAPTTLP